MNKLRNILGPLRVLDAVNRAGGVARAAECLHVTPGAVSHQIRALEAALDTRLCRKVGREAVLTASGMQLASRLAELFDRVEDAVREARSGGKERRIRLKVIPSFAIKWLMPRLASFYESHSDIDLEVATVTRADDVSLGDADFVVRRGHGRWPGTHAQPLFDDVLALACAPAMARDIRCAQDVLQHKLLHSMIAPVSWDTWLAKASLPAQAARLVPLANAALCLQAAVQGVGIALTQKAYMREELERGLLAHPLDMDLCSGDAYYLVSAPGTLDIRHCADFAAWVRSVA
jgi:DNA-binding transcriptional LysR family regulator